MAEQEQSRSEPATPHRLEQARQRGTVARSLELNALAALATLWGVLTAWGADGLRRQFGFDAQVLAMAGQAVFDPGLAGAWLLQLAVAVLGQLLPVLLPLVAVALLVGLLQAGVVFSTQPLKPDPERLNPVAGLKRLFSKRLLFEAGKNLVKLLAFGVVLWLSLRHLHAALLGLQHADARQLPDALLQQARTLVGHLLLAVALVALADLAYSRWSWRDMLKMSHRELREEHRHREGDPRIRARLRELRRELLQRSRGASRLPGADVLVTNPTHLAVALQYRRERMDAPEVIAMASGEAALQLRTLARRHRVPIVENPSLAQALFRHGRLDQPIPEALYPQVARLLVWVAALKARRDAGGRAAAVAGAAP